MKNQSKLLILFVLFAFFAFSAVAFAAPDNDVKVFVDGTQLSFDVPPTIIEGTTLVPMRAIFEAIGADVQWDQNTKTATGTKGGNTVSVQIGNAYGTKNGVQIKLLQAATLIDSRTLIPLRFVSESLDCTVNWDGNTKTITILTTPADPSTPTVTEPGDPQPVEPAVKYYRTKTGKKYHYENPCGNGTYFETTWEEIQQLGLEPCEKCVR